jgi:4-oxalocrotonate tautomerase
LLNWPHATKADNLSETAGIGLTEDQEAVMPLIDIQLIKGVFTPDQKKNMISKVTDAMVSVEGEAMRGVTWVRVQEIESGEWAIGGKPLTSEAVRAMATG